MISLKTDKEIKIMRQGGKILASTLDTLKKEASPGVSLEHLNNLADKLIRKAGAVPSFKDYKSAGADKPYPASACLSLNDEVVHGLAKERKISEGDILTIDLGVFYKGFHTDSAVTVGIGKISDKIKKLISTTEESLAIAIGEVAPGVSLGTIGFVISDHVHKNGFTIVDGLVGHGVGQDLQEDPIVANFGQKGRGEVLKEGMVIAIEPMVSAGTADIILDEDGFTYKTADGSLAAHFEHTVAVTKDGYEILTEH